MKTTHVLGNEIGHVGVLRVVPTPFHGIEVGRIGRQPLEVKPTGVLQAVPGCVFGSRDRCLGQRGFGWLECGRRFGKLVERGDWILASLQYAAVFPADDGAVDLAIVCETSTSRGIVPQ